MCVQELGFILYCEHPHKFILNYVQLLTTNNEVRNKLAQHAWNFINDSQRTNVCIKFAPEVRVVPSSPSSRSFTSHAK